VNKFHPAVKIIDIKVPPSVTDLVGGYLTAARVSLFHRYRLLTSKDYDHFYATFKSLQSYDELCSIFTGMQCIPFMVNSRMLAFIEENSYHLEEVGLLAPAFLASVRRE
jgi:hypothetical protein